MLALVALLAISGGAQGGRPSLGGNASKSSSAEPYSNTYSLTFDGTGDYVNLGQPADLDGALNAREMTMSLWVKRNDSATRAVLTRHYVGSPAVHAMIDTEPGPLQMAYMGRNVSSQVASPSANAWHHIVARIYDDAGTKKVQLAVDGALTGSVTTTGAQTLPVAWLIGCRWTSVAMVGVDICHAGLIDEVSFWSVGFTAGEISELYNSGTPGNLASHSRYSTLLHWYRMGDGDTLPTITDRKGTSNGTVSGDCAKSTDVP